MRINKIPSILEDEEGQIYPRLLEIFRIGIALFMLTDTIKFTFKDAAKKLTGNRKRDFMAKVTEDYFESSRMTEQFAIRFFAHSQLRT